MNSVSKTATFCTSRGARRCSGYETRRNPAHQRTRPLLNTRFALNMKLILPRLERKGALVSAPVLGFPYFKGPKAGQLILDTDFCQTQTEGILSQVQQGQEVIITYGSKKLNKTLAKLTNRLPKESCMLASSGWISTSTISNMAHTLGGEPITLPSSMSAPWTPRGRSSYL